MEYMIQAYVIYEKASEYESPNVERIRKKLEELCECLSYSNESLKQRLSAQREFLRYRHDERLDNQQDELIEYFGL